MSSHLNIRISDKIPIGIPIGILSEILIGIFPIGIFPIGIPIYTE
jgi:hypothetical protein